MKKATNRALAARLRDLANEIENEPHRVRRIVVEVGQAPDGALMTNAEIDTWEPDEATGELPPLPRVPADQLPN